MYQSLHTFFAACVFSIHQYKENDKIQHIHLNLLAMFLDDP